MNIYAIFSENKNISLWGRQGNLISIFFFSFLQETKSTINYQKENQSQKITFLHQKYTEMHGLTRESHAALKRKKTLFISLANICQTARLAQHPFKDDPFSQQITQLKAE